MSSVAKRLKEYWAAQKLQLGRPVTVQELHQFEERNRVNMPRDLREYWTTVGGMADIEMDQNLFSFLPFDELVRLTDEPLDPKVILGLEDPESCFFLGHYLIWSHSYLIRLYPSLRDENQVLCYSAGSNPCSHVIAPTFTQFAEFYLRDPESEELLPRQ